MTYDVTRGFPREEVYGLTSLMRRAAVAVPSYIVEGCARESQSEYVRFLEMAFGSLRELHYQAELSTRFGFLEGQNVLKYELHFVEYPWSNCLVVTSCSQYLAKYF